LEDGQSLGTDASGNPILKDIGMFMKGEFKKHEYFKVASRLPVVQGEPQSQHTVIADAA
jgi:hypothetical protein